MLPNLSIVQQGADQSGLESQGDYAIMRLNKAGSALGLTAAAAQRHRRRNKKEEDGNGTYLFLPGKASQVHLQSPNATTANATVSKE